MWTNDLPYNPIYTKYYDHLVSLIDPKGKLEYIDKEYKTTIKEMFLTEFKWIIPNDDNRASDGRDLREEFAELSVAVISKKDRDDLMMYPSNLLEVVVALAVRIEDIMMDMTAGVHYVRWFWEMFANLGLLPYYDNKFNNYLEDYMEVREILEKFVNREYGEDGVGGLFPLERPTKDQRKVEIWYQMYAYLDENYPDNES